MVGKTPPNEVRDQEHETKRKSEELQETLKSKEPSREQNSNIQKQPVVSLPSDTLSTLAAVKNTIGLTSMLVTFFLHGSVSSTSRDMECKIVQSPHP